MAKRDTIYSVISDIKRYGIFYIKSKSVRDEIAKINKDIIFEWDSNEQIYTARYTPISKR